MAAGILALHHVGGTYDMLALMQVEYAPKVQFLDFLPPFLGFGIKVPMLLVDHGAGSPTRTGRRPPREIAPPSPGSRRQTAT